MIRWLTRRIINMFIVVWLISVASFIIIQLPPGDYLTTYIVRLEQQGIELTGEMVEDLRQEFGLDKPPVLQYVHWITRFVQGDMGRSFTWNAPVNELIWERLGLTVVVSVCSLVFTWIVAFPIGIYAAVRQYSPGDYFFTFLSFIGLATPNFFLALIFMYIGFRYLGVHVGGLYSPAFANAPWSLAKFADLLKHLWIPMIVVGTAGTAGLVRTLRANLLDELKKQYVVTARAKGLRESRLVVRYPVRVALNPFISGVGGLLPALISGATITAVVLNLPTTGPFLLGALQSQDMYLAGSFIMMLSILSVIGTLMSDVLLVIVDPRIRFEKTVN